MCNYIEYCNLLCSKNIYFEYAKMKKNLHLNSKVKIISKNERDKVVRKEILIITILSIILAIIGFAIQVV